VLEAKQQVVHIFNRLFYCDSKENIFHNQIITFLKWWKMQYTICSYLCKGNPNRFTQTNTLRCSYGLMGHLHKLRNKNTHTLFILEVSLLSSHYACAKEVPWLSENPVRHIQLKSEGTKTNFTRVPSRIRALTKSRSKSTSGVKVNIRRRLGEETPSASVAKCQRRQEEASPR